MPDASVVDHEVTRPCFHGYFILVSIRIEVVFFSEEETPDTLPVCAGEKSKPAFFNGRVVQVKTDVEHWRYFPSIEKIARAVGVPAHVREVAALGVDIVIKDHAIFFVQA